jgi:hypothetical protein
VLGGQEDWVIGNWEIDKWVPKLSKRVEYKLMRVRKDSTTLQESQEVGSD